MTANVHGSSGSTSIQQSLEQPREQRLPRPAPRRRRWRRGAAPGRARGETPTSPSRRGPCGRRFPASAPAPSTPSRRRRRPPRAPAPRARTRRPAPKSRADARSCCRRHLRACGRRPALPVPSRERFPSRWSRATSDPAGCARRTCMPRPGRCVLGTKMVWRTGPSSDDLMLPTTPTTVHSTSSLPLAWSTLIRRRRPSGLPSGNCCLTSSSLTIATGTESTVSDSEKSRPATCGIPIVLKNPGVIGRTWLDDSWPSAGLGRSTRQKLVPMHANGTGRHEAPAAC